MRGRTLGLGLKSDAATVNAVGDLSWIDTLAPLTFGCSFLTSDDHHQCNVGNNILDGGTGTDTINGGSAGPDTCLPSGRTTPSPTGDL